MNMQRRQWKCLVLFWPVVLLLAAPPAWKVLASEPPGSRVLKYEEPQYLTGAIYASGGERKDLLFNFKRVSTRSGTILKVQRDFTYPDGKIAARERVVYSGDTLVTYQLEEMQIGASGTANIRLRAAGPAKGRIEFEYSKESGARPKLRSEPLSSNALIADMIGPFLASHWDSLQQGQKLKIRYIVVPRTETVGFTFVKESDAQWRGRDVIILKMEATSKLLAILVDPLFFTIEKAPPHRVLQYAGRTTPKLQVGGKWKDLDATTVFDWESAR